MWNMIFKSIRQKYISAEHADDDDTLKDFVHKKYNFSSSYFLPSVP